MARVARIDPQCSVLMTADLVSDGLDADVDWFLATLLTAGIEPTHFRMPFGEGRRFLRKDLLKKLQAHEDPREGTPASFGAIADGEEWVAYANYGAEARIMMHIIPGSFAGCIRKGVRQQVEVFRAALRGRTVSAGSVRSHCDFGRWLPDLGLVKSRTLALVTTKAEVEAAFEQPDVFWNAGWDSVEQFGDQWLLTRGLEDFDSVSWVERAAPHYWAMARAAKPGQVRYYWEEPPAKAEEAVYTAGRQTLEPVAYLKAERVAEYSCLLEPSEHISGWEIMGVARVRGHGKLPRGRKVEAVRVVFLDRETAEREKRPLVEVGVEVWCYGPDGDRERVE